MAEGHYQSKLKKTFEEDGWTVLKLSKLSVNGYPDLLLLHPNKKSVFIEVKDTGGKLSPLQTYRIDELKAKGFTVFVSEPKDFAKTVSIIRTFDNFIKILK